MKFDYNKKEFTQEEKEILLKESKALLEKYPDRIPLLVQLDSNVLKLEKHKFLVNDDINISYYIDVLKTKLIHINSNDSLTISLTKFNDDGTKTMTRIKPQSKLLKEFYQENKDPSTGMLIFTVSRQTTVKWVKGLASYYLNF